MKEFGFPKSQKIKAKKEFQNVYEKDILWWTAWLFSMYCPVKMKRSK